MASWPEVPYSVKLAKGISKYSRFFLVVVTVVVTGMAVVVGTVKS